MDRLAYYDENIPCLAACPVHTNAGMYVAAIADGDDELAYLTARLPNPFASVCGRVCAAPCEDACRRGQIDRPIAIRALKRFVTEQFGPERDDAAATRVWEKVTTPPAASRARSRRARSAAGRSRSSTSSTAGSMTTCSTPVAGSSSHSSLMPMP